MVKINRFKLYIMLTILLVPVLCSTAYAHRVNIFAYIEGNKIFTESYFSKKKRVHQGKIQVFDLINNKLILTGITDDDGNFVFPLPEEVKKNKSGLQIILDASEGHRGEWTLSSKDLFPGNEAQTQPTASPKQSFASAPQPVPQKINNSEIARLNAKIDELSSKIDTVKRLVINQQEDGPGIKEIFSGIGYIFGLFGTAAFLTSRKSNKS